MAPIITENTPNEESKVVMERAERQEYHRLLYGAMTRAEDRLYICGWEGVQKREAGIVWYDLINDGLDGHLTPLMGSDGMPLRRIESQQAGSVKTSETKSEPPAA